MSKNAIDREQAQERCPEETEIEKAVLDVAEPGEDYKPLVLAKQVATGRGNADWTEDAVLAAIWRLILEGKLMLTPQRLLRRVGNAEVPQAQAGGLESGLLEKFEKWFLFW